MKETGELNREKLLAQLKKENVDENLMQLQALETAEQVWKKTPYKNVRISAEPSETDAAQALFTKFFQAKAIMGSS